MLVTKVLACWSLRQYSLDGLILITCNSSKDMWGIRYQFSRTTVTLNIIRWATPHGFLKFGVLSLKVSNAFENR